MTDKTPYIQPDNIFERREQPAAFKEFLKSLELARRQISLYGADHPNSRNVTGGLSESARGFLADCESATCVFTAEAVIVNERYFTASTDSNDLLQRIRARGAMAVTLLGVPREEELLTFVAFLNVEPREVRTEGGPSEYLRNRGVSRIIVTESVYTTGGDSEETNRAAGDLSPHDRDLAVASAIDWLTKQNDTDDDSLPKLPVMQILSDPESAAKLIMEAVTKLHASRRENTSGEVASEVVNDLKSLASTNAEEWDKTTPQIRKAISKLPREMRPSFSGFTIDNDEKSEQSNHPKADITQVELMVSELPWAEQKSAFPEPSSFEKLFEANAYGPLSSWRAELQPRSIMHSAGTTMATLLRWEKSPGEHGRIASALAELAARAIEIDDPDSALLFLGYLIDDTCFDTELNWKRSNVASSIQSLKPETLVALIERGIACGSPEAMNTAASLIDLCPNIAPDMVQLLGAHASEEFKRSLKHAIVKTGTTAAAPLSSLLRDGSHAGKLAAIDTLVETGRAWALEEIAAVVDGEDTALAVQALKALPRARVPMAFEILIGAISHPTIEVRCAAIEALGEFGDPSALPYLDKIANRRCLFARNRFDMVRQAARQASERIRAEHSKAA